MIGSQQHTSSQGAGFRPVLPKCVLLICYPLLMISQNMESIPNMIHILCNSTLNWSGNNVIIIYDAYKAIWFYESQCMHQIAEQRRGDEFEDTKGRDTRRRNGYQVFARHKGSA